MDANTEAIIALAWARELTLAEDTFSAAMTPVRKLPTECNEVSLVSLFDRTVVQAPQWFLAATDGRSGFDFALAWNLMGLAAEHSPRLVRDAVLLYLDEFVPGDPADDALITDDPGAVAQLEARCPPDDVEESALLGCTSIFVMCDHDERPVAAAGYRVVQGLIADLSLLTSPDCRRKGFGRQIHNVAINDALYEGLVPQSRSHVLNPASRKLARGSGFVGENREIRIQLAEE